MKKGWIYQAALLAAAGLVLWFFISNTQHNLETRKIASGFGFLWREAGFEIGECRVDGLSEMIDFLTGAHLHADRDCPRTLPLSVGVA